MDFTKQVSNGIKFLQDKGYDLNEIDLSRLDLSYGSLSLDGKGCVLCQLFGDYSYGVDSLQVLPAVGDTVPASSMEVYFGFHIPTTANYDDEEIEELWNELTNEWKKQLTAPRTQPVTASDDQLSDMASLLTESDCNDYIELINEKHESKMSRDLTEAGY